MRLGAWLVAVLGLVASAILLVPSGASAQERTARSSVRSELLDPFPRAGRHDLPQITEMVVEIIDPFEGTPHAVDTRTRTEILDPFRTSIAILSEILDPWAS
ncbi:MAG: hypothetical protein J0L92_20140 [Deltaproteobacteria bacterium]|nr:hypothetical protein [Deltaproteobacteria bacterium]